MGHTGVFLLGHIPLAALAALAAPATLAVPLAATSPYAQRSEENDKHQTSHEYLGPPTEYHLFVLRLLLRLGNRRVLRLIRREKGPLRAGCGVVPIETNIHEIGMRFARDGRGEELDVWVALIVRAVDPVTEIKKSVCVAHCEGRGKRAVESFLGWRVVQKLMPMIMS